MEPDSSHARTVSAILSFALALFFAFDLIRPRLSPPYNPNDVRAQFIELLADASSAAVALVFGFIGLTQQA